MATTISTQQMAGEDGYVEFIPISRTPATTPITQPLASAAPTASFRTTTALQTTSSAIRTMTVAPIPRRFSTQIPQSSSLLPSRQFLTTTLSASGNPGSSSQNGMPLSVRPRLPRMPPQNVSYSFHQSSSSEESDSDSDTLLPSGLTKTKTSNAVERYRSFSRQKQVSMLANFTSKSRQSTGRKRWSELNPRSAESKVVIAVHDYSPSAEGDLAIKKGDIFEVGEDGHLWWYAKNVRSGDEGYIPSNHVKPVGFSKDDEDNSSFLMDDVFMSERKAGRKVMRAIGDFKSDGPEDVSFRAGDEFVVLNDTSSWWYVRHGRTGQEGFIPSNYVQCFEEEDVEDFSNFQK